MNKLIEYSSQTIVFDNYKLNKLCETDLKIDKPNYQDLNSIVASLVSDSTCGFRFPGQINFDLRKQLSNLIAFPRLKFFMATLSPMFK